MKDYYELSKTERAALSERIKDDLFKGITGGQPDLISGRFADEDTYKRKAAYLAFGRIWLANPGLHSSMIAVLDELVRHPEAKVRQTAVNAAGEIGMKDFDVVENFFDYGLNDTHHSVRNAVIGSVKKMGQKNPLPVLKWAEQYLHHPDKEIRREICHGIELRGRTHPQDILPLLKRLQHDKTARVRNTLVHVLGQIAYKKGCLETVVRELETWENKELVKDALEEIIDVHDRYRNFAYKTTEEARKYITSGSLQK